MAESLIARYWHRKTGCEITGVKGEGTCQIMHDDSLGQFGAHIKHPPLPKPEIGV